MRSDQELAIEQPSIIELDMPSSTYRVSFDVDMVPAGMTTEQACGLFISALEAAGTVVRHVRINQCSTLTSKGMRHRAV
jgi:hypothetical protein